jgi:hypothetical protein
MLSTNALSTLIRDCSHRLHTPLIVFSPVATHGHVEDADQSVDASKVTGRQRELRQRCK